MSEGKVKGYYERIKELLGTVAFVMTIISGVLLIATNVYIPNSIAFEIAKYFFLIMIPITVSILAMQIVLRGIRIKLKAKPQTRTLSDSNQKIKQLDKRMNEIEADFEKMSKRFSDSNMQISSALSYISNDVKLFKKYFVKCPNCSNPMFLPILPSMVLWKETHEKDGAPSGRKSKPEYEIACPSCQKTWHIVYRK